MNKLICFKNEHVSLSFEFDTCRDTEFLLGLLYDSNFEILELKRK